MKEPYQQQVLDLLQIATEHPDQTGRSRNGNFEPRPIGELTLKTQREMKFSPPILNSS